MKFHLDLDPPPPWPLDAGPQPVTPLPRAEAEAELGKVTEEYARRAGRDRLSDAELGEMVAFQVGQEDLENRRKYFRETPLEKSWQGQILPLVEQLLADDPTIRAVMNVGARYAFADHAMAVRHPGVQFAAVDFMPNLAEMNAEFRRDNLEFVSGYALDELRRGRRADVVFFSSTALTINNAELRCYVEAIAQRARYLVFNEVLHHSPDGTLVNPLDLPVDRSAAVRRQNPTRGGPLNVVHNYKAIAEAAGFRVLHYQVRPFPPFEPYRLELVAVKDLHVDLRLPWAEEWDALRARHERRANRDRMSAQELAETVAFQTAVEDLENRRAGFRGTPLPLTIQGQAVPLVEAVLRRDPEVRSVLDVGVRYGYVDALLADRFPRVQFTGVDFMENLREFNADFAEKKNLRFVTGYALDLLEAGELEGDLVVMIDTALTIHNRELRRYLRALAARSRYVVVVDPLHRSPDGGVEDPLSLSVEESLPVYTPPVRITPLPGPLCYRHNYKGLLEEAGFETLHYRVFPLAHYPLNLVGVVGRRRGRG